MYSDRDQFKVRSLLKLISHKKKDLSLFTLIFFIVKQIQHSVSHHLKGIMFDIVLLFNMTR